MNSCQFIIIICSIFFTTLVIYFIPNLCIINDKEPLQNYELANPSYEDFPLKLKDETDADLSGVSTEMFYTPADFNQVELVYYDDIEIQNDIKYFNNASHIISRKQIISGNES